MRCSVCSAAYGAAGDMTCRSLSSATTCSGSSPTGQKLTYDNEGRLVGWQNTWATPTSTATDAYDGEGTRVAQQSTPPNQPTSTTYYVAGGLEEINNNALTKYESVPGVISVAIQGSGSGESVSYLATDGLGSVSEELDGQGNVLGAQLYGPYGTLRYGSGVLLTSRGYTGQYADAVSGLDDYGARYYDPTVGQFTAADTVLAGGLNRYAYVGNNPETATDPTGNMYAQPGHGQSANGLVLEPLNATAGSFIEGPPLIDLALLDYWASKLEPQPMQMIPIYTDLDPSRQAANQGAYFQPGTPLADMGPETINQGTFFHPGAGPGPGTTPTTTTPPTTTPTTTPTAPTTLPVTQSWAPPTSYPSVSSDDPCIDSGMGFVRNACVQWQYGPWIPTVFNGQRVYQRDDLIDPNLVIKGMSNLERMLNGNAPIGPDGKWIILHHMLQTMGGPLAELTTTMHQQWFSTLHINPPTMGSGINRPIFNSVRAAYWMWRAQDFLP